MQPKQHRPEESLALETPVPAGKGDYGDNGFITDDVWVVTTINEDAISSREPVIQQFWVEPGASASLYTGENKGTHSLDHARDRSGCSGVQTGIVGVTRLVDVPASFYTVTTATYGTITATQIELTKPLSHVLNEGWQDQIYVTFQSTVGPNVADILEYIVEQYTDLTCDPATFAHVKTKLEPFPANFPINDRKNVVKIYGRSPSRLVGHLVLGRRGLSSVFAGGTNVGGHDY